jgi:hypothetical protein
LAEPFEELATRHDSRGLVIRHHESAS